MRIVGGRFRSRRLIGPRAGTFRPTSDRVRESLFNLLGPLDAEIAFADVFAGSGAVGLEALSRGAGRVVWVEAAGSSCWSIRKNIEALGVGDEGELIQMKAAAWVVSSTEQFDVVYADPPYELPVDEVMADLTRRTLLRPEGRLILEHSSRQQSPAAAGGLERVDERKYGDSLLAIYRGLTPYR